MANGLISVIVPIHNAEPYLSKCIDSIIGQSYQQLEIILVDDGSTDGSGRLCDAYQKKDKRISVIHQENKGLVRSRKIGLSAATGEYAAYVDADDWLEPGMYELLLKKMQEYDAELSVCARFEDTGEQRKTVRQGIGAGIYGEHELKRTVFPHMISADGVFEPGIFAFLWDKLFLREKLLPFQMAVPDETVMGEDAAVTFPYMASASRISIIDDPLYHYRQTGSSMVKSMKSFAEERRRFSLLYGSLKSWADSIKDQFDFREQIDEYVLFLMIPRAEYLYEGLDELDFLFPFPDVKKGERIILYGMGTYGQFLARYLKRTGFCEVEAIVDRNHEALSAQGFSVKSPDEIERLTSRHIVLALSYTGIRERAFEELQMKYPQYKISKMDTGLILSGETKRAFGLVTEDEIC
ncbi:MAG: glycosyltransferase [Lachnospiraceae bacterium]|nr:glycosyltransferase [Lachnospiraceae bacterium]